MKFRKLNEEGVAQFGHWIVSLNANPKSEPPWSLLSNPATSEETAFELPLAGRVFEDRAELGEWLTDALKDHASEVLSDAGFWSSVALVLIDQICAPRADGARKPGEMARYVFEPQRKSYRHLVWAAWWAINTYGENGRYLLMPVSNRDYPLEFGGGEIMGQIAANQMTTSSQTVIRLGRRLYEDPETKRQSKGSSGKGADSPRRLIQVLRQFQLTYDFESMSDDALAGLLPKEFSKRLSI